MTENQEQLSFRQAISGKWQVPLFIVSMLLFVVTLLVIRPKTVEPTFDEKLEDVVALAESNHYDDFYAQLNLLKDETKDRGELAKIYSTAAETRVGELKENYELGIGPSIHRSARQNYENIIGDYQQAFKYGWMEADDPRMKSVYTNVAFAYWGLGQTDEAIEMSRRAIDVAGQYESSLYRRLATMYLTAMPEGYQDLVMSLLDTMLADTDKENDTENYAWAFVKKVEVLISQGNESQAQSLLNSVEEVVLKSSFGEMVEFLRAVAVRKSGDIDTAEKMLRELLSRLKDRGDIYAQLCLELGEINYNQYRYQESQNFYNMVIDTQLGKDWYLAAMLGTAECIRMQYRYPEAIARYRDTLDLYHKSPLNRCVKAERIQSSLAKFSDTLTEIKDYNEALTVLEMEQEIAAENDVDAAYRYAISHHRLADELIAEYERVQRDTADVEETEQDQLWNQQQADLIEKHFTMAAEQYLRVARIGIKDNQLYGRCVREAAICYDSAGNPEAAIEVWKRFVEEWEGTSERADALFRLAQTYQSLGQFDEAIRYFKILREENPRSPAGFKAIVPMSQCYISMEPPDYKGAEAILQSVLDNEAINPDSPFFREAMLELGQLYYHVGDYPSAISCLTNAISRYPDDPSIGKAMFLAGDSYRKRCEVVNDRLKEIENDPTARINRDKLLDLRREMLMSARDYFAGAIKSYNKIPEDQRDRRDRIYLKHSWLYQADSLFDLGEYRQAVDLYEQAALRYQMTPTALMALVQVVNCHIKLGNPRAASSANSRAVSQLARMGDKELMDSEIALRREDWEQWFDWADNLGLW